MSLRDVEDLLAERAITVSYEAIQLGRILSAGGFDPARDIAAITVTRWPHGYAKGLDPKTGQIAWRPDEVPPERAPWVTARHPRGRIAIANSDTGARAMTEIAIGQAHRAVSELLSAKT